MICDVLEWMAVDEIGGDWMIRDQRSDLVQRTETGGIARHSARGGRQAAWFTHCRRMPAVAVQCSKGRDDGCCTRMHETPPLGKVNVRIGVATPVKKACLAFEVASAPGGVD